MRGFDDAVQDYHVVDERRSAQPFAVEHEHSAEPQHYDNHQRAEEFAHGVGHLLACVDAAHVVPVFGVDAVEPLVHLFLGAERFYYAQSAQCFLHWLIVSLHSDWAFSERCLSLRPTKPITQPIRGTNTRVNSVSCQLTISSVVK